MTTSYKNVPKYFLMTGLLMCCASAPVSGMNWWPEQKAPTAYCTVDLPNSFEQQVVAQAVAGHQARLVNEGRGTELVWFRQHGKIAEDLRNRTVARLKLRDNGVKKVDDLLLALIAQKQLKGYVLYTADVSTNRPPYEFGAEIDQSLNTACMASALLKGVPITSAGEPEMKKRGLTCLFDARSVSPGEFFTQHRQAFAQHGALAMLDPKAMHNRDLVIAHCLPVTCGTNDSTTCILEGVRPPAMVVGWGLGDEFAHCRIVSRYGHFHTASNWILNVPFYSAGSNDYSPAKIKPVDEKTIDYSDKRRCVAFLMSDGDNTGFVQMGLTTARYWGSPTHGSFPMGFSACMADLAGLSPVNIDFLSETKPPETSLVQFSGGYFYPDHFGSARTNRTALLRAHLRNVGKEMERSGVRIMTAIFEKSETPESLEAMQIIAEEIPSLLGLLVMDYAPYHRGKGRIVWLDNGRGDKIPAVAARYCLWQKMRPPLAGEPHTLPAVINSDDPAGVGGWASVHAWSSFEMPDGKTLHGVDAVQATVQGIDTNKVHVVSPEEFLYRLRHKR